MNDEVRGGVGLLTACQIRAARAMLRWSVNRLAEEAGVSSKTIRRLESVYGIPNVNADTLLRMYRAFAAQGMAFIWEDGAPEGPGLRWGRYPGRKLPDKK